ncbi:MAG: hypothetical protein KKD28_09905 [Chloroflexi bacterium]|nr:hypothetical protein [Chloroflexota bacterium]MBU1661773.1 hypothetical protein [Chloroflexota bacterium]
MNVLDENILENQRQILQSQRIHVRQIGDDVGRKGMKDDKIISWLPTQRNPTFFTRDLGFHERKLCHARYCLVCLAVGRYEVATFVRRLLRHREFNTQARRMGTVIRVSRAGLKVWRLHIEKENILSWNN